MTNPDPVSARIVDPRAVRVVALGRESTGPGPVVIEPAAVPLAPVPRIAGTGVLGGAATAYPAIESAVEAAGEPALLNGSPTDVRLDRRDELHAILVERAGSGLTRTPVLLMPLDPGTGPTLGTSRREVIVDGWTIEVEVESERRASLRERARRGREEAGHHGPTEVRAIIPGRVVAVSIVPGDPVVAGQQLLVVEAMKMQNELRAPRDGVVSTVAVGPGRTIEVGDLLLVLQ